MIRIYYTRTVFALVSAMLVAALVGLLVAVSLGDSAKNDMKRLLVGSGVRLLLHRLETSPTSRWPTILDEARPHFDFDLRVVPATERPAQRFGPQTEFDVSIRQTDQLLILGPIEGPSLGPIAWPLLAFAATVLIVVGGLLPVVLAAQLDRTQRAIRLLGEGRWDHRLNADAEGPLRSLAEHVNRTAAQLSTLFREREELLQAVSHELGTPLSRMRFQLEVLESAVPAGERKRIEQLHRDLDELDELSLELVGWVEAGAAPHQGASFTVREVLEPLLELACQDADHLVQRLHIAPDLTLHADPRQFQRAMENLLRNAVRYAKETIVIAVRIDDGTVVIDVRDDGPGVPPDHRERLFEPFTRVEGSRSRDEGGLGLGLAIVHRIVTTHGGAAVITEAPEGGACVRTRWPGQKGNPFGHTG